MDIFSIGGTHFAVDGAKSRIRLAAQDDGMLELDIDIHGDDDVFMRLTEAEEGEWSWALYPPVFFLHGLRLAPGALAGGSPGRHDDAQEAGIYMMQYRDIAALDIVALSARRVAISGLVDFDGKQLPFHVDVTRSGPAA
ncbi:hypothetical protein [Janthinobacterium sp.]|uniref:hypothetical protein n=1 Tax=Janthinobacterium sp. TaxID=1871054 RepID=UPI0025C66DB9|nr:hypothetical protein [Janthinobacterium sp.]NBV18463.1 hypothetical protein [Janthinobacterium sp.]|eukprot:gene24827-29792_t